MSKENRVSDELAKKLDALAAHFEAACHVGDAYMVEENAADAKTLRDAADALRSKPVAGVEVKPLGWKDCATNKGPGFDIADRHRLGVAFAETPIGTYVIASGPANLYEAWLRSGQVSGAYKTKDEAKAAAKADPRQRILSTLSLSAQEPVAFVSPDQFEDHGDPLPDEEPFGGLYLPIRLTRAGNFTLPLYASPQPKAVITEEMVERLRAGIISASGSWHPSLDQCRDLLAALKEA